MDTGRKRDYSIGLAGLRRRFEQYRRARKVRTRIPEELWDAAAKLAGRLGIYRTCEALRLNYYDLKKRVERKAPTVLAASKQKASAALAASKPKASRFIELLAPADNGDHSDHCRATPSVQAFLPAGGCDCTVELEDADGAKMRIRIQGMGTPDLAELGRSFWSRRS